MQSPFWNNATEGDVMAPSRQEMRDAQKRIQEEAEEAKRQLAAQLQESFLADVETIRASIEDLAKEAGMTSKAFIEQHLLLVATARPKRVVNAPVEPKAPKYRDPETGRTWAGQGQPPRWFTEHVQSGTPKDDLLIANQANGSDAHTV